MWIHDRYIYCKSTFSQRVHLSTYRLDIKTFNSIISLRSSGMRRKQNFDIVFGYKSDTAVLTFTFPFLSSPLFSLFLLIFFFPLAGHLVGFILMGRVFRKAFRILGLGERKGRWVMEQDFHGNLQVNLAWFFAVFSGVLFTLHKLADKVGLDR